MQVVKIAIEKTREKPGPSAEIYGPRVDQSECRILQSHIIISVIKFLVICLVAEILMIK